MKRWLFIFVCFMTLVPAIAATMYLATEKKYAFTADNLEQTIPEFIENENKQKALAQKWVELMDKETGMVSIADLFTACRAGGFNTYRVEGFTKCRAFIVKLLENAENELDDEFLTGYCPGLDENGKNPNALRTITDKTQVGDFCSSSNIYAGEVVFRKGYNCTCMAFACNTGYEFKGGACVTMVADGEGNCLRKEFPKTDKVNTTAKAVEFCQDYAKKNKCKLINVNMLHSVSKVVCNPTQSEVDNVKAGMLAHKDKLVANLQYYEVCKNDVANTLKGQGKKTYCVDLFKSLDIGMTEAVGFAELYAQEKHNLTIHCAPKDYRQEANDDYIKCATLDKSVYYEFRFDDVIETNDNKKRDDIFNGLMLLYNIDTRGGAPIHHFKGKCSAKIENAAKKFGWNATYYQTKIGWPGDYCGLSQGQIVNQKQSSTGLRTIDGLDSRVGINIQTQGSTDVRNKLLSYVRAQGFLVTDFDCDRSYGTVWKGGLSGNDDILTCYVTGTFNGARYNKQPVDFVFDDMSEGKKHQQQAGDQGLNCVAYNGNFDGHYCRKLTKEECLLLEKEMLKQGVKSWDGSTDLVDWDEKTGACELNSAQFANNINKTAKYTAIVGLTVAGAFTGGTTTAAAISLMAVEMAGIAGEMYTERKKEVLPQQWANEFLAASIVCQKSSCAEETLRKNFAKISQSTDMLNRDVLTAVDKELARLAELIPQERLDAIMANPDAPSCWDTWECQEYIFVGMQMASLAAGVGKGLVNLTRVISGKAGIAVAKNTKVLALTTGHADDAEKLLLTAGNHSDDLLLAAGHTDDLLLTAGHTDDLLLGAGHVDDAMEMTAAQAKKLRELETKIAGLESKGNRTAAEASQLRKFRQERNTLLNKLGTKDADDLAKMSESAFNRKAIENATSEYNTIKNRYNYVQEYMAKHKGNLPSGMSKYDIDDINREISNIEKRLQDLGQEVTPTEPLSLGNVTGAASGAKSASAADNMVYNLGHFGNNPSAIDDAFKNANNIVQVDRQSMSAADLREVMQKAKAYGFECSDCGSDVLRFSKIGM